MSWTIRWSNAAKGDLLDIWLYIAADNPAAADRQIARIEAAVWRLAEFPKSAPARDDIGLGVRGLVVNRCLVLYRVVEGKKAVDLLRVVDGRRDLAAVFAEGEP